MRNLRGGEVPWKRPVRFKDMAATEHLDYDSIYQMMTRPNQAGQGQQGPFSFASQIPQVLDTKGVNSHVTPLIAEQSLSDILELETAELTPEVFNKAIYSNVSTPSSRLLKVRGTHHSLRLFSPGHDQSGRPVQASF